LKGTNVWHGSGNIASEVSYGRTGRGEAACNFRIIIEQAHKQLSFVRVNVYGGNVEVCRLRDLSRGDYVIIHGELMNRQGNQTPGEMLTEVRCLEIVIIGQQECVAGRRGNTRDEYY